MISLGTLVMTIIYLIVIGLVWWLLWWLVGYVGLPEPFNKIANVVLAITAVLAVIFILLGLVSGRPVFVP
jgi:hypothetical protein